ncbi:M23 family metallopeptidase, partial [Paenibacillus sp. MMO-177]|uniref:M23 family metallopeptidase n=1 Tax=Paenibacillus sp. MMO-177 TaxID=3081289 RepID=UPI0030186384
RLMYQNGAVSYINVLLQSNSFMDFIDRIESLKIIIAQDQSIIEQNQADATNISLKQTKMEEQMLEVKELRLQTDQMMSELRLKEQEKQVLIASLEQEQKALLTVSKDQEIKLLDMAREAAALKEKKKTLEEQALKESEHEEHQTNSDSSPSKGTGLIWPFAKTYPITSPFGGREDPITGEKDTFHKGIDIGAPGGTAILAAQSGTVLLARWTSGYGNTVIIDHGNGMWTLYAHIRMNGIKVEEEEKVNRGQKIAEVGSTGNSTGNHLHFEVRINEEVQNPMDYL